MKYYPKVSVITFVYANSINGRKELFIECLKSIKFQNYPNYEHLIIDDGSDVDLKKITDSFPYTKYIKKTGSGILSSTDTFNLGHEAAQGKYCIYLPSDDLHFIGAIRGMADALESDEKAQMAIGRAAYEYSDGREVSWTPNANSIETKMGLANYVNGCAVMWRRCDKLLELLPPNYTGFCSDYDIWCTLIKLGKVIYPDVDVVKYRQADDSTRNKTRGKFIASPRVQDSQFFQYSKQARLEFVKDRYSLSINEQQGNVKLIKINQIEIDNEFIFENILAIIDTRNWKKAHEYLVKYSREYEEQSKLLRSFIKKNRQLILVKTFNISSIVLMQYYKQHYFYDLICDESTDNWNFDFLPLPFINTIYKSNTKKNTDLLIYLGCENNTNKMESGVVS